MSKIRMHKCLDCDQEVKSNNLKSINIALKLEGYERFKGQLKYVKAEIKNIEDSYDRVLEKQDRVGISISSERGIVINTGNKINIEELAKELEFYRKKVMSNGC